MNDRQQDSIKQLEIALQRCKQSGIAFVGIDGHLYATVTDEAFKSQCRTMSSCEAVLSRSNDGHAGTVRVKTHSVYLDSGAT